VKSSPSCWFQSRYERSRNSFSTAPATYRKIRRS